MVVLCCVVLCGGGVMGVVVCETGGVPFCIVWNLCCAVLCYIGVVVLCCVACIWFN